MALAANTLRELLLAPGLVQAPGVYDGITAKLVQAAGFDVAYQSGYGVSATHGKTDTGILGLEDMTERTRIISEAISIPLVADADTGYRDVMETVRAYIDAGAAGIQLEDQSWPKRCGHMEGKSLVSTEEMTDRIDCAVEAREKEDLVIIARTDAIAVHGFDSALERAAAYADAGADALFVEAPETLEQLQRIPEKLPMLPQIVNIAPKTPNVGLVRLEEMGYALAIYPGIAFTASMSSIATALNELKTTGIQSNLDLWKDNFDKWNSIFDGM